MLIMMENLFPTKPPQLPHRATLTRADGLHRLHTVLPSLGRSYTTRRNVVPAPGKAATTSLLSPYLRRRLITESETISIVLQRHGAVGAEKFIDEVFWRTYWKGYLQANPAIWARYHDRLKAANAQAEHDPALAARLRAALDGATGIGCFDAWVTELRETGFLHNHVRMWFASIWIFTLGLPWEIGAAFFLDQLIDGDPASNTLSWRWVAGLHTVGKHYVARAENIARYTEGRYDPRGELNETPVALAEDPLPPPELLQASLPMPDGMVALLLHAEDGNPETLDWPQDCVGTLLMLHDPAEAGALSDIAARAEAHFNRPVELCAGVDHVLAAAGNLPILTPFAPIGPTADALAPLGAHTLLRDWDRAAWPRCTRGFFGLKAQIPRLLGGLRQ